MAKIKKPNARKPNKTKTFKPSENSLRRAMRKGNRRSRRRFKTRQGIENVILVRACGAGEDTPPPPKRYTLKRN